jgi:branched-chain amino acid transport system permease protein
MPYIQHIIILLLLYSILAISLNYIVGESGILTMCHSIYFACGAYSAGIFFTILNLPFFLALLFAVFSAIILSLPFAIVSLKLRHDTIVLFSLGYLLIFIELLENLKKVTGGLDGLPGIRSLFSDHSDIKYIVILSLFLSVVLLIYKTLKNTVLVKSMNAFRDFPKQTPFIGIKPGLITIIGFTISSSIAAICGVLYASYSSYINPTIFDLDKSILLLSMVLIGGAGTLRGPVLGAVVLVLLPEGIRFIVNDTINTIAVQQIIYGGILLLFTISKPDGLLKGYRFD